MKSPADAAACEPALEDYAAVGDGRSITLIASDGRVAWWCVPNIDDGLVLARDDGDKRMITRSDDDLRHHRAILIACTFWLVEAYAELGRMDEARALMNEALAGLPDGIGC